MMSPLAQALYGILRAQLSQPDPRITYAEAARRLRESSEAYEHLFHRSRELYAALTEIGQECRRRGLPPLPALVVRADTGRPGAAYYTGKCTGTVRRGEQIAAWRADLEAVKQASYPAR
jgi:hypothetical protein